MVARTMGVKGASYEHSKEYNQRSAHPAQDRPCIHYDNVHSEMDPFPDSSLLHPLDEAQHDHNRSAVDHVLEAAKQNGLTNAYRDDLTTIVNENFEVL